jgi:hypothetical protein
VRPPRPVLNTTRYPWFPAMPLADEVRLKEAASIQLMRAVYQAARAR